MGRPRGRVPVEHHYENLRQLHMRAVQEDNPAKPACAYSSNLRCCNAESDGWPLGLRRYGESRAQLSKASKFRALGLHDDRLLLLPRLFRAEQQRQKFRDSAVAPVDSTVSLCYTLINHRHLLNRWSFNQGVVELHQFRAVAVL